MKKAYFSSLFFAAILISLVVAGCQKDGNTLRVRMDSFEGPNGKVYMSGMAPAWSVGDTLMVNGEAATILRVTSAGATITVPTAASYAALYPYHSGNNTFQDANGAWHFFLNSVQPYYEKDGKQVITAPMAAYTTGGTLTFHNLGALLCIQVNNNTSDVICVDAVTVESVGDYRRALCGAATVEDYTSATAAYTIADNPEDWNTSVTLQKATATGAPTPMSTLATRGSKAFYVHVPAVPANANNRFSIKVTYHKQGSTTQQTVTRTQASPTGGRIARNQLANVGFDMFVVQIPEGAIDARFSVSGSKQVYFSKGNLQYQASSGTWRFADNQYDIIGNAAGNTTAEENRSTQSAWIDLFGWATSGGGSSAHPPYLCSVNNVDYWSNGQEMTDDAEYDWGWHNAISNGGNENHKWRTLTSTEWNYLLGTGINKRNVNGSYGRHYSYDLVTLTFGTSSTSDDINGILIYPDGYTQQLASTTTSIAAIPDGCVFLPAAGQRAGTTGTTVTNLGCCYYWTATKGSGSGSDYNAKCLAMTNLDEPLPSPMDQGRQVGSSVRLVQNCNQQ